MRYILCFALFAGLTASLPLGGSLADNRPDARFVSPSPGSSAASCLPTSEFMSAFRNVVADSETLVDRGDFAAARDRIAALDVSMDGAGPPIAHAVAHWPLFHRAIDRGLDRALLALQPAQPNRKMSKAALRDLLAATQQARAKRQISVTRVCP